MEHPTDLETAVLDMLLAGEHPILQVLREQAAVASVFSREFTGAGFFCSFRLPPEAPRLPGRESFRLGDVNATASELEYGAGFVLFIRDGLLDTLEGYSYEEPWPERLNGFKLAYQHEPRELDLPELLSQKP